MSPNRPLLIPPVMLALACHAADTAAPSAAEAPAASTRGEERLEPPATRTVDVVDEIHGVKIPDPYRWLEDQAAAETRAWIAEQNAYTDAVLARVDGRDEIRTRVEVLMVRDWIGTPSVRGDRYFFSKRGRDEPRSKIYARRGLDGQNEVLVDPADYGDDASVSIWDVSEDGRLLAYGVRRRGEDELELRIFDIDARKDLPDRLPRALYSDFAFRRDGAGFYYVRRTRTEGGRVRYHELGTDVGGEPVLFGEGTTPDQWVGVQVSPGDRYLLFTVQHGWARGDVYFRDLRRGGETRTLVEGVEARFSTAFAGKRVVMRTNWDAPRGRLFSIDLRRPARKHWREIVPQSGDSMRGFTLAGEKIYVRYLHDVSTRIEVFSLAGKRLGELEVPPLHSAGISGRWESDEAFVWYDSFTTPPTTEHVDLRSGKRRTWHRVDVPVDPEAFETRQVWYASKDGTRVPMFLVHRRDTKPNGALPTYLTGYGGFNVALTPGFSTAAVLVAERGGLFAMPNIRGGGEYGEGWHRAGMLENKQNVFDDFIAAATHLVDEGYTRPERLGIQGRSNGGLLMGAVLTQRPDLFRVVLCEYPDLDMVRYYTFTGSNNPPALLEYGNAADPEQFEFLHAYSPYQAVKPDTAYPAVMLTSGDGDTRVPPLQARKMAARLQAASTSGHPVVLLYDTETGHAGGRTQAEAVDYMARKMSFFLGELGVASTAR